VDQLRSWLTEKQEKGVKQVRISSVLAQIDSLPSNGAKPEKKQKLPRLLGTAEAADFLGVERPRIGKWLKMGVMPTPVADLAGTPVWTIDQIRGMTKERERRRRRPRGSEAVEG
jgi:hypothetical protein